MCMKCKRALLLFISLLFPLTLSACQKGGPVEELELHDLFDGVASLNPLLTWKNDGKDNYNVSIKNDSLNQTVETYTNVSSPYSLGGNLDLDTTYTVTVTDKRSKKNDSVTFTTMKEGAGKMDSLGAFLLVYGAFDNNMIIQRDKPFKMRGFADVGVQVSIMLDDEVYSTISEGDWEITIPAHPGSIKGHTLKVIVSNKVFKEYTDVLFGDVFLVAGQSNMQWPIKDSDYEDNDLNLDSRMVRFFAQNSVNYPSPSDNFFGGKWFIYNRKDEGNQLYSAIGIMLGSMLSKSLKDTEVPIGIMYAAQGSTNISSWISADYYHGADEEAGYFYNAMVYPFKGLNIKGAVWYQGCNDSSKSVQYKANLLDLFSCYRNLFNDEKLPFFVVQLPCFDGDDGNKFNFAFVRDAQYKACMEDENAYLIATCDGGDPGYIHPSQKRYICERLEKSILATIYGYQYLREGPTVKDITINGNEVTVSLNNAKGLNSKTCKGFVLAGEDGRFHEATARIEQEKIIVSSTKVDAPIYIRYGFSRSPFLDIYNEDGYLLSPFRNDNYDLNIDIFEYEDISVYQKDTNGGEFELSVDNGAIHINKPSGAIDYCSLNMYRWAPINTTSNKFRFTYQGTGSNAEIQVRFIESSYEIWALSFIDDTAGKVTKEVDVSEVIKCTYNPLDEMFDREAIMQVGLMVKGDQADIKVFEARFI